MAFRGAKADVAEIVGRYSELGGRSGSELLLPPEAARRMVDELEAAGARLDGADAWYVPADAPDGVAEAYGSGCHVPVEILQAPFAVPASAAIVRDFIDRFLPGRTRYVSVGIMPPVAPPTDASLDDQIDPQAYARGIEVHVGLRSTVMTRGFPAGYQAILPWHVLGRLIRLGELYGLRHVARLEADGEFGRLESAYLARELRWLPKVSADPLVLAAARTLAELAETCKSSSDPDDALVVRVP